MERLEFKRSRAKTGGLILLALLFVAGGIAMGRTADETFDRLVGWACAAFFGAAAVAGTRKLLQGGTVFTLDRAAITDEANGVVIPWSEIDHVSVLSIRGAKFLSLSLRNPEQFLARVSAAQRSLGSLNERMGWGHWGFSFTGITPGVDAAMEFIRTVPDVRITN